MVYKSGFIPSALDVPQLHIAAVSFVRTLYCDSKMPSNYGDGATPKPIGSVYLPAELLLYIFCMLAHGDPHKATNDQRSLKNTHPSWAVILRHERHFYRRILAFEVAIAAWDDILHHSRREPLSTAQFFKLALIFSLVGPKRRQRFFDAIFEQGKLEQEQEEVRESNAIRSTHNILYHLDPEQLQRYVEAALGKSKVNHGMTIYTLIFGLEKLDKYQLQRFLSALCAMPHQNRAAAIQRLGMKLASLDEMQVPLDKMQCESFINTAFNVAPLDQEEHKRIVEHLDHPSQTDEKALGKSIKWLGRGFEHFSANLRKLTIDVLLKITDEAARAYAISGVLRWIQYVDRSQEVDRESCRRLVDAAVAVIKCIKCEEEMYVLQELGKVIDYLCHEEINLVLDAIVEPENAQALAALKTARRLDEGQHKRWADAVLRLEDKAERARAFRLTVRLRSSRAAAEKFETGREPVEDVRLRSSRAAAERLYTEREPVEEPADRLTISSEENEVLIPEAEITRLYKPKSSGSDGISEWGEGLHGDKEGNWYSTRLDELCSSDAYEDDQIWDMDEDMKYSKTTGLFTGSWVALWREVVTIDKVAPSAPAAAAPAAATPAVVPVASGPSGRRGLRACRSATAAASCAVEAPTGTRAGRSVSILSSIHSNSWRPMSADEKPPYDGAEGDLNDNFGLTLLCVAAELGRETSVKALLKMGAMVDAVDETFGQTPLSWAATHGQEDVVKQLLEWGPEVDAKDKCGRTPLSWAAKEGHGPIVMLLLEKGAAVDAKGTNYGMTPLHFAAEEGHEIVVELLLESGAEEDATDISGGTPLFWAAANGYENIVKQLLKKGAGIETKNCFDQTPLSGAAVHGHEGIVKLLLAKGAEKETKDCNGRSAADLAAKEGYEVVSKLLIEWGAEVEEDLGGVLAEAGSR
ncbi:hypothetical protein V493_01043 [Pseudogymnoascus sp. VKM F-4281 (FW-2241)]|nr:hypothetical protein V493_01043 [Pseudogymnoascus sp. VKM F-4281 (FW-2241)]